MQLHTHLDVYIRIHIHINVYIWYLSSLLCIEVLVFVGAREWASMDVPLLLKIFDLHPSLCFISSVEKSRQGVLLDGVQVQGRNLPCPN